MELQQTMKINGKPAFSGTVIVKPPEEAEISTPFGEAKIVFSRNTPDSVSYDHQIKTFNLGGFTNEIGTTVELTVIMQNQARYYTKFVIYSIGDDDTSIKIIHYTIY